MQLILQPESKRAIYLQIADEITRQIEQGILLPGQKLPTVRDLSVSLQTAKGTVKHAYEHLAQAGLVEMQQGKGTFITSEELVRTRKERAMEAIDTMFDTLDKLSFTTRDIEIFLQLKLDAREDDAPRFKILLADCNPEVLQILQAQVESFVPSGVYKVLLDDLMKKPYTLDDEVDLVVTTPTHQHALECFASDSRKIVPVVLGVGFRTIADLSKLEPSSTVMVLCESHRFAEIVKDGCVRLNGQSMQVRHCLFGEMSERIDYILKCDVIILPVGYEYFCNAQQQVTIAKILEEKPCIFYKYSMDSGSMLYLKKRVDALHL